MANNQPDILDLSERGEALRDTPSMSSSAGITTETSSRTTTENQSQKAVLDKVKEPVFGRAGCALFKQKCREWDYFPTLEAEFSFTLEYLAAKAQSTFREIEVLEQQNRMDGRDDYKFHSPDNEFGHKKDELTTELLLTLEKYDEGGLFHVANTVMNQHAPTDVLVHERRRWSRDKVAFDPLDRKLSARNYRALGPRPSLVDNFLQSIVKTFINLWTRINSLLARFRPTHSIAPRKEPIILSYTTFHILSHLLVVFMAVVFFVMPLSIMYIATPKNEAGSIAVAISFSLLFCVGSFYFGGGSGSLRTDTKFLLLFAYTSVMATLLSNLAQHQEQSHGSSPTQYGTPA
ncbi:hypothetical protein QBC41DRAFT_299812 [Cercophora samala]|uniref:DUF6594 domain-containing protein n=1 Tax=Cercophora samala TaxID=330535 RepID=A0AA39ZJS8_9PEZI|nr:hypothetical protein QBC41DRAFT_299812 [Cercophora samala]